MPASAPRSRRSGRACRRSRRGEALEQRRLAVAEARAQLADAVGGAACRVAATAVASIDGRAQAALTKAGGGGLPADSVSTS